MTPGEIRRAIGAALVLLAVTWGCTLVLIAGGAP